jgi:hypothetical protein
MISLTGSVRNYISNYIYCITLEPDQDYTDVDKLTLEEFNKVSPDFKYKVIDMFQPEIQELLASNKLEG